MYDLKTVRNYNIFLKIYEKSIKKSHLNGIRTKTNNIYFLIKCLTINLFYLFLTLHTRLKNVKKLFFILFSTA